MNHHPLMIFQAWKELWRNQEVLAGVLTARDVHHALVDHSFVARIHTLIDLVDDSERCARKGLECHEVENG